MCNKCNDTGYVAQGDVEFEADEICTCAAGQALCGGVITDGRQDQGNDSLGMAKATVTWIAPGGGKRSIERSTTEDMLRITEQLEQCGGTDVLVNGLSIDDYLTMRRGCPK
jgi:hypothetical protein